MAPLEPQESRTDKFYKRYGKVVVPERTVVVANNDVGVPLDEKVVREADKEARREIELEGLSVKERQEMLGKWHEFDEDDNHQAEGVFVNGVPAARNFPMEANSPTENEGLSDDERKVKHSRIFSMAVLKWVEVQENGKELTIPKFVKNGDKIERAKKEARRTNTNGKDVVDRVDDFEKIVITKDFWLESFADEERSELIFRGLTERFLERLIVHGKAEKLEDGTVRIKQKSDKDGQLCEKYRKLAGIGGFPVEYVDHDYRETGVAYADMGNKDGVCYVIEQDMLGEWVATIYFDHHDPDSAGDSSASGIMFETFAALGMIEKETADSHEKILLATRKSDNGELPDDYQEKVKVHGKGAREYFVKVFSRTVYGQDYWLTADEAIRAYVDDKHDLLDELDEVKARKYKLIKQGPNGLDVDYYHQTIKNIESAVRIVQEIERAGLVLETKEYGLVLIDIGGRTMGLGNLVAKGLGYGGILRWNEETNSFALTTVNGLVHDFGDGNGFRVRKGLWMREANNDTNGMTLEEVLEKISDGEVKLSNGLIGEQVKIDEKKNKESKTQRLRYLVNDLVDDLSKSFLDEIKGDKDETVVKVAEARQNLVRIISRERLGDFGVKVENLDAKKLTNGIVEYMTAGDKEPDNWEDVKALMKTADIDETELKRMRGERMMILGSIKNLDLLVMGKEKLGDLVPMGIDTQIAKSMYRAINTIVDGTVYPEESFKNLEEAVSLFKRYMKVEMPELKPTYYPEIMRDLDVATLDENEENRRNDWLEAGKRLLANGIDLDAYTERFSDDLKEAFEVYTGHKKDSKRFKEKRLAVNAILDYFKVERIRRESEPKPVEPVVDTEGWKVVEGKEISDKDWKLIGKLSELNEQERESMVVELEMNGVKIMEFLREMSEIDGGMERSLEELHDMVFLRERYKKEPERITKEYPGLLKAYAIAARMLEVKWG